MSDDVQSEVRSIIISARDQEEAESNLSVLIQAARQAGFDVPVALHLLAPIASDDHSRFVQHHLDRFLEINDLHSIATETRFDDAAVITFYPRCHEPMTEIEYTTEEGGEWISARTEEEKFVRSLETWAQSAAPKIDPERRIPLEIEGGNVVPAAAIRLPNGRVIDAILGCFRDDREAVREACKGSGRPIPSHVRAYLEQLKARSDAVQAHLGGEGPDPLPTDETDGD